MKGELVASFTLMTVALPWTVIILHSSMTMMVTAFVPSAPASHHRFPMHLYPTPPLLLLLQSKEQQQQQQQQQHPSLVQLQATTTNEQQPKQPQQRKPWDFGRFVQQSSKFVNIPLISRPTPSRPTILKPGDVLWQAPLVTLSAKKNNNNNKRSFSDTTTTTTTSGNSLLFTFAPLDDVVMGGASASNFETFTGTWRGTVTDANNGGFVGIRSTPQCKLDLSTCQGLEWKLRARSAGNNYRISNNNNNNNNSSKRRFKVILRDSADFNGICWTTSVDLDVPSGNSNNNNDASVINTVRVPFRRQVAALFAKTVPNQIFRPDNVVGLQLTYSKFEYDGELNPNFCLGDLDLEIMDIRAY